MMIAGALRRGLRDPFRSLVRATLVVVLLALVTGLSALMVQASLASRQQIARLEARVRTLIELREAGAFGTGGFGRDSPVGEQAFSVDTLEKVRRIPSAGHLARVDEYVYTPLIDPTKGNAYAMVIGLRPEAALRAIGEVDYEHAQIVAGRPFDAGDHDQRVAVVGRLYAEQRLGAAPPGARALGATPLVLNGTVFRVVGIYATGNDFGDNHVFIPLEAFRSTFSPGRKLSKIFVTVDAVAHVERVVTDLTSIPEADVVNTPEAVSTARTTLGSLAVATTSGAVLLFAIGSVLITGVMALSTRERVQEVGTLKAIGASDQEIVLQFLAEAATLSGLSGLGAAVIAAAAAGVLARGLSLPVALDGRVLLLIGIGSIMLAALGSLYPVIRGLTLSPVEAMRRV